MREPGPASWAPLAFVSEGAGDIPPLRVSRVHSQEVVAIPLTIRCECGETHSAKLGETVSCSCGRVYDTKEIPAASFAQIRAHQAKAKLYARVGMVFVIGLSVAAFFAWGKWGAAVAAPVTAAIWFRVIRPWFMRTFVPSPGELPTLELEASNK